MAEEMEAGKVGFGVELAFTPDVGTPFGTDTAEVLSATPPGEESEDAKYTPISGDNAGKEQSVPGKDTVQTVTVKMTYAESVHAAASAARKLLGELVLTLNGGGTLTGRGYMKSLKVDDVSDTGIMTSTSVWTVNGGLVYAAA